MVKFTGEKRKGPIPYYEEKRRFPALVVILTEKEGRERGMSRAILAIKGGKKKRFPTAAKAPRKGGGRSGGRPSARRRAGEKKEKKDRSIIREKKGGERQVLCVIGSEGGGLLAAREKGRTASIPSWTESDDKKQSDIKKKGGADLP